MRAKATENLILGMERQASGRATMRGRIQPRRAALASCASAPSRTRGLIFCPTCGANGNRLGGEYAADDEKSVFVYAGATAPAYMIHGSVTYRIITDNHGSVRLVVNAETGEVAQRLDYDSFGRVLRDTNPGFQPFGFQGGLYDPDTGLVEFGCRWYDAYTGRWISKDPIGLRGGINFYEFCKNNAIAWSDSTGLRGVHIILPPIWIPVEATLPRGEREDWPAGKNAQTWASQTWASKMIGPKIYNHDQSIGGRGLPVWRSGMYRCNLFVADAYNYGNGREIIPTGLIGSHPPSAFDWYNGNVTVGFVSTTNARPGDIVAVQGHVGIVSRPGNTISASSTENAIVENDWGFRPGQDVRIWHYSGGGR